MPPVSLPRGRAAPVTDIVDPELEGPRTWAPLSLLEDVERDVDLALPERWQIRRGLYRVTDHRPIGTPLPSFTMVRTADRKAWRATLDDGTIVVLRGSTLAHTERLAILRLCRWRAKSTADPEKPTPDA